MRRGSSRTKDKEQKTADSKTVLFKIKRQPNPKVRPHWEEFEPPWHSGMNVISSLMEIAANPVTREGKATTPITYDSNCLEEVCGSCAMLINGRARMACSALVDKLEQPIRLEPFSIFPVVRDLAVDRSVLFENLKAVKAWCHRRQLVGGSGPRMSMEEQERPILFPAASPAAVAWKRVPSSTRIPASSALPPFHRSACSIPIPPERP